MKRHGVLVAFLLLLSCAREGVHLSEPAAAPPVPPWSPPSGATPPTGVPLAGRPPKRIGKDAAKANFSRPACEAAYNACIANCDGPVLDNDEAEYLSNTDFAGSCEDACATGGAACDDADRDERCDEFASACEGDCDSTVFDYDSGDYRHNTDADSKCEDACSSGQGACD